MPDISIDELSLDQKVAVLMGELPKPLQDFLLSPERDAVSAELTGKYHLHADQAGVFAQAYIYMLLGVYSPEEFVQELRDTGIPEPSVQGLTQDVNERVFKRLQNAERNLAPVAPTLQAIPQPVPPIPVQPVAAPRPFVPNADVFTPPVPAIRTMAQDMQMMKEEKQHPHAAPQAFAHPPEPAPVRPPVFTPPPVSMSAPVPPPHVPPVSVAPAPLSAPSPFSVPASASHSFQTSSVPNTGAPFVPPAPVAAVQLPMPPVAPAIQVPTPLPPPVISRATSVPIPPNLPGQSVIRSVPGTPPIIKEYGIDPYRETPE